MATNAKDLAKKVEALRAQAEALDASAFPRGVFLREAQSVEDAVREADLPPGARYFLVRFWTQEERRAREQEQEQQKAQENADGNS